MRFHLTHVPGLQTKLPIPLVFFHKLSMLIVHATAELRPEPERIDLCSNGIVFKMVEAAVVVILRGPNLFLLVNGPNGGEYLSRTYRIISSKLSPSLIIQNT